MRVRTLSLKSEKVRVGALSSDDYVAGSLLPVLLPCATCSWELLGQCPVIVSLMSARLGRLVGQGRRVQRLSCIWLSKRAVDKRRKEKQGWSYVFVYSPVMIVNDGLLRASIPGKLKKLPCASRKLAFYG